MALTQVPIELSSTPGIVDNSNATAITIDSSEKVGIGTSSPSYTLSVNSGSSTVPASLESTGTDSWLMLKDTNTTLGNVRLGSSSNSLIAFAGGSERMRITSGGNVGIGTNNPIVAGSNFTGLAIDGTASSITLTNGSDQTVYIYNSASEGHLSFEMVGDMRFRPGSAERMRITSDGELLLNATDNPGAALLHVEGPTNKHAKTINSHNGITGSSETAIMAEGTVSVDTVSSGTVLSIPFQSQGSVWRRYTIEFMFCSGEYNDSGNGKSGTATVKLGSLTSLSSVFLLDSTGTVSSVGSSGMNLQITFSSGFTGGLSNYEGVLVYYKILSSRPSYCQMWNATLN